MTPSGEEPRFVYRCFGRYGFSDDLVDVAADRADVACSTRQTSLVGRPAGERTDRVQRGE